MERSTVSSTFKYTRVENFDFFIRRFTDEELGSVDYVNMVDFMDYIKYPTELPSGLARVSAKIFRCVYRIITRVKGTTAR